MPPLPPLRPKEHSDSSPSPLATSLSPCPPPVDLRRVRIVLAETKAAETPTAVAMTILVVAKTMLVAHRMQAEVIRRMVGVDSSVSPKDSALIKATSPTPLPPTKPGHVSRANVALAPSATGIATTSPAPAKVLPSSPPPLIPSVSRGSAVLAPSAQPRVESSVPPSRAPLSPRLWGRASSPHR